MIRKLLIYNTHLTNYRDENAFGPEKQNINQAHLHHHLGQNRPHQKTITHPQGPPPELPQPHTVFFGRSEGLIGPPLPRLHGKVVPAEECLLFGW